MTKLPAGQQSLLFHNLRSLIDSPNELSFSHNSYEKDLIWSIELVVDSDIKNKKNF